MKRTVILLLIFALISTAALAEQWFCPACARASSGNFCSNCGEKKPARYADALALALEYAGELADSRRNLQYEDSSDYSPASIVRAGVLDIDTRLLPDYYAPCGYELFPAILRTEPLDFYSISKTVPGDGYEGHALCFMLDYGYESDIIVTIKAYNETAVINAWFIYPGPEKDWLYAIAAGDFSNVLGLNELNDETGAFAGCMLIDKSVSADSWNCGTCGQTANSGKFCPSCGSPKSTPAPANTLIPAKPGSTPVPASKYSETSTKAEKYPWKVKDASRIINGVSSCEILASENGGDVISLTAWGYANHEYFNGSPYHTEIWLMVVNADYESIFYTVNREFGASGIQHKGATGSENLDQCDFTAVIDVSAYPDGEYYMGTAVRYQIDGNTRCFAYTFGDDYNFRVKGGKVISAGAGFFR